MAGAAAGLRAVELFGTCRCAGRRVARAHADIRCIDGFAEPVQAVHRGDACLAEHGAAFVDDAVAVVVHQVAKLLAGLTRWKDG